MSVSHRAAKYTDRALAAAVALCIAAVPSATRVAPPAQTPPRRASRDSCSTPARRSPLELWGFTAPWDPRSAASVKCNAPKLSVVISGWLRLDTLTAMPVAAYPDTARGRRGPRRFALVTTYQHNRFHRETIERLAADPALRGRVAHTLARWAADSGYRGLVLDFEGSTRDDTAALAVVVRSIADSAHRRHIRPVAVAVVPTDTLAYASRFLSSADLLVLMLYDEHWATGAPGPLASPAWVQQALALRVGETGASRLVAALPAYGYLWKPPAAAAVLSFGDAEQQARAAGVPLLRDSASATLHFTRADSAEAWVADAELTRRLAVAAESLGIRRFALWRLGLEDPGVWRAAFGR